MRLARFQTTATSAPPARLGVVVGDEVAALPDDVAATPVADLLAGGADAITQVARATRGSPRHSLADVFLRAPVPRPGKFLAIGLNYADHAREGGRSAPDFPVFFNKQITCVTGPGDPIHVPEVSEQVDFEGELGVVIGRRCRHVPAEHAAEVVGGYIVVNDVSVRDWQRRSPTMTLGKSFDTHGPTGPWLVTADEVPDPHDLELVALVNGDVMQHARTSEMLVDIWHQIATLSAVCTLEPGDIVSTGTPAGVGAYREPPRWLRPGDVVQITVERVGTLENPVIAEPPDTACR